MHSSTSSHLFPLSPLWSAASTPLQVLVTHSLNSSLPQRWHGLAGDGRCWLLQLANRVPFYVRSPLASHGSRFRCRDGPSTECPPPAIQPPALGTPLPCRDFTQIHQSSKVGHSASFRAVCHWSPMLSTEQLRRMPKVPLQCLHPPQEAARVQQPLFQSRLQVCLLCTSGRAGVHRMATPPAALAV